MEKTLIIVGIALALVVGVGALFYSGDSMSTGEIVQIEGKYDQISKISISGTHVRFTERQETSVIVRVKNEGESGTCKVVIFDLEGHKLKTGTTWLGAGQEKEVTVLLNVHRGRVANDLDDVFKEYKVEILSRQGEEWLKTDQGTLDAKNYQIFFNGKKLKSIKS